jgi:uncharacterized protein (DUF1778 family)
VGNPQKHAPTPARLNCRISARIKRRAAEAAGILGQSMTAFTEFASASSIQLSDCDFELFVKAIDNAPAPTAKLRKAAKAYKKRRLRSPVSNW